MAVTSLQSSRPTNLTTNRISLVQAAARQTAPVEGFQRNSSVLPSLQDLSAAEQPRFIRDEKAIKGFVNQAKQLAMQGNLNPATIIDLAPQLASAFDPKAIHSFTRTIKASLSSEKYAEFRNLYKALSRDLKALVAGTLENRDTLASNTTAMVNLLNQTPAVKAGIVSYLKDVYATVGMDRKQAGAIISQFGFGDQVLTADSVKAGLKFFDTLAKQKAHLN